MKTFLSFVIKLYTHLLALYPRTDQDEFAQDMLLDFSDLARDASQRGVCALALFCLRELIDFPISLLQAHSRENHVTPAFHSGPTRGAFQGALALGLAFAVMMFIMNWIIIALTEGGWLFLLRIANSQGWHLNYNGPAQLILYFFALIVGALLAGILVALCFHELSHLKRYLLLGMLGWAAPLALARLVILPLLGYLLKTNSGILRNMVLQYSWILLTGLGLGAVFSLIVQDRKKTPWLLLAGTLGCLAVANSTSWILLLLKWILLPFHKYISGPSAWTDLTTIAVVNGIIGIVLGAILGAISGWPGRKTVSA